MLGARAVTRASADEHEELVPLTARWDSEAFPDDPLSLEAAAPAPAPASASTTRVDEDGEGEEFVSARYVAKVSLPLLALAGCLVALLRAPVVSTRWQTAEAAGVQSLAANLTPPNWGAWCFEACKGPGLCPEFCGLGNACCQYGNTQDPPECHGILAWGTLDQHTCVIPANVAYRIVKDPTEAVLHWGDDCWLPCGNESGYCQEYCGLGNVCCRWNSALDPPECNGILDWGAKDRHTCVAPANVVYKVALAPPNGTAVLNWGQDCLPTCKQSGYCEDFCGIGNACCRWGAGFQAPECGGVVEWGSKDRSTCVAPVHPHFKIAMAPPNVLNWGQDCFLGCNGGGYCDEFCGRGNVCCRYIAGDEPDPPECLGITEWGAKDKHTCVQPSALYAVSAAPPGGTSVLNWGEDCTIPCGNKTGFCQTFCGKGNACCRFGDALNAPECHGITTYGSKQTATCVAPVNELYWLSPSPYGTKVQHWGEDCFWSCGQTGGACPDFCGVGNACCRFGSTQDPPECHGITVWGSKEQHTCVAPVAPYLYVNHFSEDCSEPCNGAGYCEDWCGEGNACCRYGQAEDPHECRGVTYFPTRSYHTCVKASGQYVGAPPAPVPGSCIPGMVPNAKGICTPATSPALMTFYMYYAAADDWAALRYANLGNLAGAMAYLHDDVVTSCPRMGRLNRLIRFTVTMRNPDPLYAAKKTQFGPYSEFEAGLCVGGNSSCAKIWETYGYVVGCRAQGTPSKYANPVRYSLPGGLGQGGECSQPDGKTDCTWKAHYAGEVRLDELSGIIDNIRFCKEGEVEYDPAKDRGNGTSFWNHRDDATWCEQRVAYVQQLFKMKYPDYPTTLGEPVCDSA